MKKIIAIVALAIGLSACSSSNVEYVKAHANAEWEKQGFKVVGYEGYQRTIPVLSGMQGGAVWYIVERNGITYHGAIGKWEDEFHIYNLTALDAIGSKNQQ